MYLTDCLTRLLCKRLLCVLTIIQKVRRNLTFTNQQILNILSILFHNECDTPPVAVCSIFAQGETATGPLDGDGTPDHSAPLLLCSTTPSQPSDLRLLTLNR